MVAVGEWCAAYVIRARRIPGARARNPSIAATRTTWSAWRHPPGSSAARPPRSTFPAPTVAATRSPRSRGANGTVVMFICNHCPYVKAVVDKIVARHDRARAARRRQHRDHEQRSRGVSRRLVRPNEDVRRAARLHVPVRLSTRRRTSRRAYGAVCTPDFFGFDRDLRLVYRGRLDASGRSADPTAAARALHRDAATIARSGQGPRRSSIRRSAARSSGSRSDAASGQRRPYRNARSASSTASGCSAIIACPHSGSVTTLHVGQRGDRAPARSSAAP